MKGIKGQLSSLPVTDLMQWIDMNKKSGVLFIYNGNNSKCFCFEEGKLLMAAAKGRGNRLGDFLANEGNVSLQTLKKAVSECRVANAPFLGYLLDRNIVPNEFLKVSIHQLAEMNITDILSWEGGSFEFVEGLPGFLKNSPIKLSTNFIIFESVRKHDELQRQLGLK